MKIRALEETDLQFVHHLNNEYTIMSYWFEEPYESLSELKTLYQKHILDESEDSLLKTITRLSVL